MPSASTPTNPQSELGNLASAVAPGLRTPLSQVARKPRLLDLFCCAGGAGMGYHQAGFEVVGVDIRPQPRYPFEFIQADCLTLDPEFIASFDAIHASPPCQAHTAMKSMPDARKHLDLVPQTRAMLIATGLPYVIENVVGAPLINSFTLCGTMFGLGVKDADLQRHRIFEMRDPPLVAPMHCAHGRRAARYWQTRHGRKPARTIGIYGEGCRDSRRKYDKSIPEFTVVDGREAMECPWMTLAELCEAIPPAYTRWIGRAILASLDQPHPVHDGAAQLSDRATSAALFDVPFHAAADTHQGEQDHHGRF